MNVILCGYNWIGCKILQLLKLNGHSVFVYTHKSPYYVNDLRSYCIKNNVSYSLEPIQCRNLPFVPDIIVSAYYRHIIKKEIIESCNGKIFNLHPSILPQYRGCSSLTWAIINNEKEVGFSYHYIDEGVDTGNIILQKKIKIEEFDTQATLYHRVMFEAASHFVEAFNLVIDGYEGKEQDIAFASYYKRGCPFDGVINPEWTNLQIENFIRAMIYPPLPTAKFIGQEVFTFDDYVKLKHQA